MAVFHPPAWPHRPAHTGRCGKPRSIFSCRSSLFTHQGQYQNHCRQDRQSLFHSSHLPFVGLDPLFWGKDFAFDDRIAGQDEWKMKTGKPQPKIFSAAVLAQKLRRRTWRRTQISTCSSPSASAEAAADTAAVRGAARRRRPARRSADPRRTV